jgi:DNA-binding response OmpR family regulator
MSGLGGARVMVVDDDETIRREFRLLTALVTRARRTLSPEQLLGLAWDDPAGDPRRVKVYVG